jgi:glutamyl endopeptidase
MSKTSTHHESTVQAREGKTYGYQPPQESMTNGSRLADRKQRVVSAFEEFMDAIAARAGSAPGEGGGTGTGAGTGGGGGTGGAGTGAGGAGASGTGTTGSGTYATGTGAAGWSGTGTAGGGAPATGTAGSGTGAGGTSGVGTAAAGGYGTGTGTSGTGTEGTSGSQWPYTGTGERPLGEAGKAIGAEEAQQMSIFSQREAYRMDRDRESTRKGRSQESSPTLTPGPNGVPIMTVDAQKHQSDSNRAPLTESKEFAPAFGSNGKSTAPTIEKMAVPQSQRPETVPAIGTVSTGRPIDAYWASFGTAVERAKVRAKVETEYRVMEVIIGPDDRVRVTNNQNYPWRCICSLLITARTGMQYIGTGWLVSPRLVLTAGHCVYMADEDGWPTQIEVIPGRNGTVRPFGSAISRDFRSVTGWTQDNDSNYDYGAILLPADKRYGEQLGWFGYANRQDDHLRGITLNLAGYPGDGGKPPNQQDGTQWFHSRGVKDVMDRQITYEIDTYGGQSGAPVWEMTSNGSRYGVAIHTWGTTINNGATRITSAVFDNIVRWAGQAP